MGYIILGIIILFAFVMNFMDAQLTLEITHPKVKGLVGFEHWVTDKDNDYNTFKLHFIWLALRWDWV